MDKNLIESRRKLGFLIAPIVFVPLITLSLWSMGIVGSTVAINAPIRKAGLNLRLPEARIGKDSTWNKMKFYEQSDRDSAKVRSLQRSDPYYRSALTGGPGSGKDSNLVSSTLVRTTMGLLSDTARNAGTDANEEKVYAKLSQLDRLMLTRSLTEDTMGKKRADFASSPNSKGWLRDVVKTRTDGQYDGEDLNGDPEMKRMEGMLDKILDIQHPERVKALSNTDTQKALSVARARRDIVSSVQADGVQEVKDEAHNGFAPIAAFYSFEESGPEFKDDSACRALVTGDQVVVTGSTVRLALLNDIQIKGELIHAGEMIYGIASLEGERLQIKISSVISRGKVLKVALSVYDLDGIAGLYIPGSITRDVSKQSTDRAFQSLSLSTLDQSVGAQAASAGIEAMKTMVGKRVRLVRVTIPASYEVLLLDEGRH